MTAWELDQEKIPHELITDSMAGHFLKEGNGVKKNFNPYNADNQDKSFKAYIFYVRVHFYSLTYSGKWQNDLQCLIWRQVFAIIPFKNDNKCGKCKSAYFENLY